MPTLAVLLTVRAPPPKHPGIRTFRCSVARTMRSRRDRIATRTRTNRRTASRFLATRSGRNGRVRRHGAALVELRAAPRPRSGARDRRGSPDLTDRGGSADDRGRSAIRGTRSANRSRQAPNPETESFRTAQRGGRGVPRGDHGIRPNSRVVFSGTYRKPPNSAA
jgi:hypothetical protein